MRKSRLVAIPLMCILLMTTLSCRNTPQEGEQGRESEGEEAGPRLAVNQTHDTVRKGVRLILAYDSISSSFIGTVENVTNEKVYSVRVEVHLSNGVELGPTSPEDLAPGNKSNVNLSAAGQSFTWWKAHAETSGPGGEGGGEHDHEHEGGHEGEHEGEHGGGEH